MSDKIEEYLDSVDEPLTFVFMLDESSVDYPKKFEDFIQHPPILNIFTKPDDKFSEWLGDFSYYGAKFIYVNGVLMDRTILNTKLCGDFPHQTKFIFKDI